ncbi:MAG TPA: FHA domain-containing protein [Candidatus Saccharimonadales bacterium]|nr:FHA domain-containing protein [Candidatus Saccharimonadales bacterium]
MPVAALALTEPVPEDDDESCWPLAPRSHLIGRSRSCDLHLIRGAKLSREHARLTWTSSGFTIADAGSTNGTYVNGRRSEKGETTLLADGVTIDLGEVTVTYRTLARSPSGIAGFPYRQLLDQIRGMISLDPAEVIPRALELLRLVSNVERAFIVSPGFEKRLAPFMTPLDDPAFRGSRSIVWQAIGRSRNVTDFVGPEQTEGIRQSMKDLQLRRIWVSPLKIGPGRPVAAVYLDSTVPGELFDHETELLMDAVVDQIAIALKNAALHSEVVELNETLEQKVAERTRQLEESRARL